MSHSHAQSAFLAPSARFDGEASGLIDVRRIGSPVAANVVRTGGGNFPGRVLTPLPVARPVTAAAPALRSQTPLYALLATLTLGFFGLAGYVVTRPSPPPREVVRVIEPTALASVATAPTREPAPVVAAAIAAAVAPEPESQPTPVVVAPSRRPGKVTKPGKPVVPGGPAPERAVEVAAKPASKPEYGVDCILGKASCGDKAAAKPEAETQAAPPDDLPERLEQADISAGTSAARAAAASSCTRLARGGEKVQVKLSIAGPTGAVIGASALEDAGNPQLAACCVGQLERASFRQVKKQQIGTVVTIKF
ncbi:hypothetical protein [Nannocystis sp.]|uniref:hypothetical protein n=1 Tax=Nannocystis sp. TaxID=1962667 RepID=UPI002427854B|nr:hypothetical protein [Nannocystis sp.]MBK7830654.1 hypothetical protein [Nannocystis sp.]MBK9756186.1 hypothetical protein [Nannocystis sp.]